jgi:hypothetical protein
MKILLVLKYENTVRRISLKANLSEFFVEVGFIPTRTGVTPGWIGAEGYKTPPYEKPQIGQNFHASRV